MTYQDIIKALAFVEFRDNGGKLRQASRKTGIPASTIYRWRSETWWGEMANNTNKHKGRRCVHQKPKCCRPSKLTPRVLEMIEVFFRDNESALQKDLYIYLSDHGIVVSKSSISRAIKLANFSRKRLSPHILGQQDVVKVGTFNNAIKPFLENLFSIKSSYFFSWGKLASRYNRWYDLFHIQKTWGQWNCPAWTGRRHPLPTQPPYSRVTGPS